MTERIALLGYGRFGRALSGLLLEAGVAHRVLDPRQAEVPPTLRASSLPEVLAGAGLVVLAMPVSAMRATLEELRPHLSPGQAVLDVGSVKVKPVQVLASVLGRDIPWAGTHPLFGPASLARGDRPLRTVVCPNELHPDAVRRARALFERLGCEVTEMSPDAHDGLMARTHVLTFFLAHGLARAEAGKDLPFAPPSFQPIARLVEYARQEVPHLLGVVQSENPYGRDARVGLMDALTRLHLELEASRASASPAASEAIPTPPGLSEVRERIDVLDRELVELLARRARLVQQAAKVKAEHGLPLPDMGREKSLLEVRRQWASEHKVDADAVEDVFRAVLRFSRRTPQD
ncbi:prephenate dehydrogenase/arogenate dehydrogenase family protein [Pyxidicoccus xibeiensis]|uniref:prephenate dehydrogenase/arogenate dehydrogenase family protein n=1 Tax=Pyxidicoccus xibeiensis TaxID=2906759 RepID=UPI0020A6EFD5|nr:prephenate dehydrogenase/arogenate dehydrogenase family protein [Pyxidicoccus xibeiensis]MCP3142743.1 prephenate dehydrogenase/arogenate dehydrogenase family protein [Pyxidicoccus xibeiensis]